MNNTQISKYILSKLNILHKHTYIQPLYPKPSISFQEQINNRPEFQHESEPPQGKLQRQNQTPKDTLLNQTRKKEKGIQLSQKNILTQ